MSKYENNTHTTYVLFFKNFLYQIQFLALGFKHALDIFKKNWKKQNKTANKKNLWKKVPTSVYVGKTMSSKMLI